MRRCIVGPSCRGEWWFLGPIRAAGMGTDVRKVAQGHPLVFRVSSPLLTTLPMEQNVETRGCGMEGAACMPELTEAMGVQVSEYH